MIKQGMRNLPASIRQQLLNKSRSDSRPFNEILQYFCMERFLFRLSQSAYVNRFVLKGAMMLSVWHAVEARSTMDIDLLGKVDNSEKTIQEVIRNVLDTPVPEDGIIFDPDTIKTTRITEDAEYHGIRVAFLARLDSARINMKLDIGFGDAVFPQPELLAFPTILAMTMPVLFCYSRESAIAEKCHAMAKLGSLNSRMKDFFDVWLLSRQFDFEATTLRKAFHLTFEQRGTSLKGLGVFAEGFAQAKQIQWKAFRLRLKLGHAPEQFADVLEQVSRFIDPDIISGRENALAGTRWMAPGPWIHGKMPE